MTTPHDRFEPGDGWREVDAAYGQEYIAYGGGEKTRYWVRGAPVPPLPTEDGTTIRVQWRGPASENEDYQRSVVLVVIAGTWYEPHFGRHHDRLADEITGFEVLAEPCSQHYGHEDIEEARRETAKAVLDRALEEHARDENGWHDRVAREFGVSS